jgi:uncharacterized protein (UPF0276 family)
MMLGFGLGLRATHYQTILTQRPKEVQWFEIISENYLYASEEKQPILEDLRRDYPLVMHGVALSPGSLAPIDSDYLKKLKTLAKRLEVAWLSDHLCFTYLGDHYSHDLLPIPYTEASLKHLISRIHYIQDYLKRPLALENASSYLEYQISTMSEAEFFTALHQATGCGILLDINNVYVSSFNHGWNPYTYIDSIPSQAIWQYHLAGHTDKGSHKIDTHNAPLIKEVLDLYAYALRTKGLYSTMIEWDSDIPPLQVLIEELQQAKNIAYTITEKTDAEVNPLL